jgi:hypothetical protein
LRGELARGSPEIKVQRNCVGPQRRTERAINFSYIFKSRKTNYPESRPAFQPAVEIIADKSVV